MLAGGVRLQSSAPSSARTHGSGSQLRPPCRPCSSQRGSAQVRSSMQDESAVGQPGESLLWPQGTLENRQTVKEMLNNAGYKSHANDTSGVGTTSGALSRNDFPKFVQFFRSASPYIEGHRGRTFVIVIPGAVTSNPSLLKSVMNDVAVLHGLGVRLVVVAGAQVQIDSILLESGMQPKYAMGYRVTDRATLKIAIEAAGNVRTSCEQLLSKGPAIPMIRRHTKGDGEIKFQPALRVVSGNYVTAKRRGVIDGTDYGMTGEVRFCLHADIKRQLDGDNIVLLSNLGFTAAGEVLNCNTYDVGLHAAVELGADKLLYMHTEEDALPRWLPLSDAQDMLLQRLQSLVKGKLDDTSSGEETTSEEEEDAQPATKASDSSKRQQSAQMARKLLRSMRPYEVLANMDVWQVSGFSPAVATCVMACCKGVKRTHLVSAHMDGALLLELYSRDGVGTMISADFYEGIRRALPSDLDSVLALLAPLEQANVLVKRSRDEVAQMLPDFIVVERETKVLACALIVPLGEAADGTLVAEVGAFCVDPVFRGSGRGDSMLDYVEQEARQMGIRRLVLLTTRTADWFEQRDFVWKGPASTSELLPERRRMRINPERNSQLYSKVLEEIEEGAVRPGKRIGY